MPKMKTNQYSTSELNLVTYLNLRNIRPERYSEEDGRGTLYYEQTADLEAAIIDFMKKCSICGIAFSEVGTAQATARRMLFDGKLEKRGEEKKNGGRS